MILFLVDEYSIIPLYNLTICFVVQLQSDSLRDKMHVLLQPQFLDFVQVIPCCYLYEMTFLEPFSPQVIGGKTDTIRCFSLKYHSKSFTVQNVFTLVPFWPFNSLLNAETIGHLYLNR